MVPQALGRVGPGWAGIPGGYLLRELMAWMAFLASRDRLRSCRTIFSRAGMLALYS